MFVRNNGWHASWVAFSKAFHMCGGGLGFEPHGLHINFKHQNNKVPCGTSQFANKVPRVITPFTHVSNQTANSASFHVII
jgi:hypothetical protein